MTVYVDDMRALYGRLILCHMLASHESELHEMADRIGVAREHWQRPTNTSGSHYDIALSKRAIAVAVGAVEITMRQAAAMNARRRVTGELGTPADALDWMRQYNAARRAAGTAR
ncbi:DUF4031 domain-containing protein [Caballeronia sp. LjRoot34]|uniref:DUF4031 domain-containing protein n=1 Tax=Caballeronia sp. LjRoot34 TaxID=3342325 RepID=UPI003ECFE523